MEDLNLRASVSALLEPRYTDALLADLLRYGPETFVVVDPVSARLMPVVGTGDPTDAANCDRTLPIFDGWTRYDIRLEYKGAKPVKVEGFEGEAVICGARWVPVALIGFSVPLSVSRKEDISRIRAMAEGRFARV